MDRDARWRALALDSYWDALLRQDDARTPPAAIAPEDAAMIARVQSLGPRTPLFPDFHRAWHDLLVQMQPPDVDRRLTDETEHVMWQHVPVLASGRRTSGGHEPRVRVSAPVPQQGPWYRQGFPYLVTTLLVLVVVAVGSVIRESRSMHDQPAMIPAAIASPELLVTTHVTSLLDVEIPTQAMPGGRVMGAALAHQTILADTHSTWNVPALRVEYVLAGTYRVHSDGPTQVIRAGTGASSETLAAGSEIVMTPGDAMVAWGATTSDYANPGSSPVELLMWMLTPDDSSRDPTPKGWVANDVALEPQLPGSKGPARVWLAQVELEPDGLLAPPPNTLQMSITLPASMQETSVAPAVATRRDGTVLNLGAAPATVYVLGVEMGTHWDAPLAPGTAKPQE